MIDSGARSIFVYMGYFCGFCGAHYSILLILIIVVVIDVRGYIKLVKSKEFLVFIPCRKVEACSYG